MTSVEGHIVCSHTDFVTNFLSVVTKSWTGIDSCALISLIKAKVEFEMKERSCDNFQRRKVRSIIAMCLIVATFSFKI